MGLVWFFGVWFSIYPIENVQGESFKAIEKKTTKMPEATVKVSPLWGGACQRHVWEYAKSLK